MTRKVIRWLSCALVLMGMTLALAACSSADPVPEVNWSEDANGISFSYDSGRYETRELTVELRAPEGCTIAYTTDGAVPTQNDDTGENIVSVVLDRHAPTNLASQADLITPPDVTIGKLQVDNSLASGRVIRAALISSDGTVSEPATRVYFLNQDFEEDFPGCLVVSVVTDPANLLDYETGIMTPGAIFDEWKNTPEAQEYLDEVIYWKYQANYTQKGKDWERPCQVQIYDDQGSAPAIVQDAGIRITGGISRGEIQKSFNIYFRDEYGDGYLDYPLFEGVDSYSSFRLRAGGNNVNFLKYKDAFLMSLVTDRDYVIAQTRPAVLFLNGEYWGPYLLSEKIDDQMLHDHFGVDADQVVIIKEEEVDEGEDEDILLYDQLMAFAEMDLTDPEAWDAFCEVMDVQSMADYFATRIYIGDADWLPDSNYLLWRTRDDSYNDGRWQYILYDVEFSSGMYQRDITSAETDHFSIAVENFPLFAAAIRNPQFYDMFLTSIKEIGSTNFAPDRVTEVMAEYEDAWQPLRDDYHKRFAGNPRLWDDTRDSALEFFDARYDIIIPIVEGYQA